MSQSTKSNLIKYGTSFLAGGGLFYLYLSLREFPVEEAAENYRMLSDAATVPGLLFIMFGLLIWISTRGVLDGVSFMLSRLFRGLVPGGRMQADEKYADYIEKRHEKAKKISGYGFLFITGLVFIAVAVVFTILFYTAG